MGMGGWVRVCVGRCLCLCTSRYNSVCVLWRNGHQVQQGCPASLGMRIPPQTSNSIFHMSANRSRVPNPPLTYTQSPDVLPAEQCFQRLGRTGPGGWSGEGRISTHCSLTVGAGQEYAPEEAHTTHGHTFRHKKKKWKKHASTWGVFKCTRRNTNKKSQ